MDPQNLTVSMSSNSGDTILALQSGGGAVVLVVLVLLIWKFGANFTAPFRNPDWWRSELTGGKLTFAVVRLAFWYIAQVPLLAKVEPFLLPYIPLDMPWLANAPAAIWSIIIFYEWFRVVHLVFSPVKGTTKLEPEMMGAMRNIITLFILVAAVTAVAHIMDQDTQLQTAVGAFGGLAAAIALRGPFENIFSYVIIAWTKPFKFGDHIVIKAKDDAGIDGTVQMIGLQSTQLALEAGLIATVPNKLLTTSVIVRTVKPEPETKDEQEAA